MRHFQRPFTLCIKPPSFQTTVKCWDMQHVGKSYLLRRLMGGCQHPSVGKQGPEDSANRLHLRQEFRFLISHRSAGRRQGERRKKGTDTFFRLRNVPFLNIEGIIRAMDTHAGTSSSPRVSYTRRGLGWGQRTGEGTTGPEWPGVPMGNGNPQRHCHRQGCPAFSLSHPQSSLETLLGCIPVLWEKWLQCDQDLRHQPAPTE